MANWHTGDTADVTVVIRDDTGALADPAALTVKHRSPAGALTTWVYGTNPEVVRDSVGKYSAGIPLTTAGDWIYQIESTGPNRVTGATLRVAPAPLEGNTGTGTGYFTEQELRALDTTFADTDRFPDAALADMRATVENELEHACNVAFIPRTRVAIVSGLGGRTLDVPGTLIRSVTEVTNADDGSELDLAGVRVVDEIVLWRPGGWPRGVANLAVTYTHGYDAPPPRVKRAALILASTWLLNGSGPVTDRATQVAAGDGVSVLNLATPGLLGSRFGVPEVDQAVREYREIVIA